MKLIPYSWTAWGVTGLVMLALWTGLRMDFAHRNDADAARAAMNLTVIPSAGDEKGGDAEKAATYTFTGLTDAMDLSEQLLTSFPGVLSLDMDTEAGSATVETDRTKFCTHTALKFLRMHGIDASLEGAGSEAGEQPEIRKQPESRGCPFQQQRAMDDVRNI